MKKILFITHDTSRTGAPFVLLYFLKWLRDNHPDNIIGLLSLGNGPLKNEFKETVDYFIELSTEKVELKTFYQDFKNRIQRKVGLKSAKNEKFKVYDQVLDKDFDLIYANTALTVPVAADLKSIKPNIKIVAHIHELNTIIKLKVSNFNEFIPHIDIIIAPSLLVKKNIINSYLVEPSKVEVCYEFSKTRTTRIKKVKSKFVVGGIGTVHWRKGSDLFLQVAKYIISNYPESKIIFTWIGAYSINEKIIIDADIEKAGLKGTVNFIGEQVNPEEGISDFDLLLLASREDPFPLAAIEAGMMGKPIICFASATGIEEVIQNGGGYIVPYLDIAEMAKKIVFYYNNKLELKKDSEIVRKLFTNFTPEQICPQIFSIIGKTMNH